MRPNKNITEWIEKAEGDYETVLDLKKRRKRIQRYIIAFHCQQCIEKYLKALLTLHEIDFPRHHDLEELLVLIFKKDPLLSFLRNDLKLLTPFAVSFRYPGEDVTPQDVQIAAAVMKRVRKTLRERIDLILKY